MVKRWLKTTAVRVALVVLVIALLWWIFVYRPAAQAKGLENSQLKNKEQELAAIKQIQQSLSSLPDLTNIKTQQIGSVKDYVRQVQQIASSLTKNNIVRPTTLNGLTAINLGNRGKEIKQFNQTAAQVNRLSVNDNLYGDWMAAKSLTDYYTALSKSLVNVLEYNPSIDMANFNLNSADTQQRLQMAKKGLDQALSQLRAHQGRYPDPALNDIINQVESLQTARNNLANNSDVNTWINTFTDTQNKIERNMQAFWKSQTPHITYALNKDETTILKIEQLWKQLQTIN